MQPIMAKSFMSQPGHGIGREETTLPSVGSASKPLGKDHAGLPQLLEAAAKSDRGVIIYAPRQEQQKVVDITYKGILDQSKSDAQSILAIDGVEQLATILLHFDSHLENLQWYWATILAGLLPTISTPLSNDSQQRRQHVLHLKKLLKVPLLLTSKRVLARYPELLELNCKVVDNLKSATGRNNPSATMPAPDPQQPMTLMLTSGSTGNSKAVPLTFKQMLCSVRGKSESLGATSESVFLNWIGLDHVADLMEIHLQALNLSARQIHVQADELLADPLLFLHLIDRHRVTHTFAPNFFLALLEKSLASSTPENMVFTLDLSCLKAIVSGGESNVVKTANDLTSRLISLGAKGQVIYLGYGLTEASAALTYGLLDPDYKKRENHEFATIGTPIRGARVRIRTDSGQGRCADLYEIGSLELPGDVVFSSYYNDPEATRKAFTPDGWFITGDRGYLDAAGNTNLSGRAKEVIVINGAKFSPQDIENAFEKAEIPKLLSSYVAAFPHRTPGSDTEGYCIVYGHLDQNLWLAHWNSTRMDHCSPPSAIGEVFTGKALAYKIAVRVQQGTLRRRQDTRSYRHQRAEQEEPRQPPDTDRTPGCGSAERYA